METSEQRIARLLGALDTLSRQYEFLLDNSEYDQALAVQDRCCPLVDEVARLLISPGVAASLEPQVQEQAQAILRGQLRQIQKLEKQKAIVQEQLAEITAFQSRTKSFRSAYGAPANHSRSPLSLSA